MKMNHTVHVSLGVPTATGVGRYVGIVVDSGWLLGLLVDAQSGTFVNSPAGITNKTYVAGVVEFDYVSVNGSQIWLCTSDGTTTSYLGNGTRTATFGDNGSGDYITVTQRNVSALADQSGLADNFVQAVAADQPALVLNAYNGHPAFRGDINAVAASVTDRLGRSAAGAVGAGAAGTLFLVTTRSETASSYLCAGLAGTNNTIIHGFVAGTTEWLNGADRYTIKAAAPTGLHILTVRQTNGVALQAWYDGGAGFGPVVPAVTWDGFRYFGGYASAANANNGLWGEAILYNRALSDPERMLVEAHLRAFWATP